jgi:hypothetical protein
MPCLLELCNQIAKLLAFATAAFYCGSPTTVILLSVRNFL